MNLFVIKATLPRLLIFAFLFFQVVYFLVVPRIGGEESARVSQAIEMTQSSPKSEQDAAIAEALRLDGIDTERRRFAGHALVVGMDIAIIYFFWNCGTRKSAV